MRPEVEHGLDAGHAEPVQEADAGRQALDGVRADHHHDAERPVVVKKVVDGPQDAARGGAPIRPAPVLIMDLRQAVMADGQVHLGEGHGGPGHGVAHGPVGGHVESEPQALAAARQRA